MAGSKEKDDASHGGAAGYLRETEQGDGGWTDASPGEERTRAGALTLAGRIFKALLSKSEQQLKLQLSGKLKIEMPANQKVAFTTLSPDGPVLYTGYDLADAVKSLSSPTSTPAPPASSTKKR